MKNVSGKEKVWVAQMVERQTEDLKVVSSNLSSNKGQKRRKKREKWKEKKEKKKKKRKHEKSYETLQGILDRNIQQHMEYCDWYWKEECEWKRKSLGSSDGRASD